MLSRVENERPKDTQSHFTEVKIKNSHFVALMKAAYQKWQDNPNSLDLIGTFYSLTEHSSPTKTLAIAVIFSDDLNTFCHELYECGWAAYNQNRYEVKNRNRLANALGFINDLVIRLAERGVAYEDIQRIAQPFLEYDIRKHEVYIRLYNLRNTLMTLSCDATNQEKKLLLKIAHPSTKFKRFYRRMYIKHIEHFFPLSMDSEIQESDLKKVSRNFHKQIQRNVASVFGLQRILSFEMLQLSYEDFNLLLEKYKAIDVFYDSYLEIPFRKEFALEVYVNYLLKISTLISMFEKFIPALQEICVVRGRLEIRDLDKSNLTMDNAIELFSTRLSNAYSIILEAGKQEWSYLDEWGEILSLSTLVQILMLKKIEPNKFLYPQAYFFVWRNLFQSEFVNLILAHRESSKLKKPLPLPADILEKVRADQRLAKKAYTSGAVSGLFFGNNTLSRVKKGSTNINVPQQSAIEPTWLPLEVGSYIGSFLDYRTGRRVAQVRQSAHQRAIAAEQQSIQNSASFFSKSVCDSVESKSTRKVKSVLPRIR